MLSDLEGRKDWPSEAEADAAELRVQIDQARAGAGSGAPGGHGGGIDDAAIWCGIGLLWFLL
jgi:hypothetical protein